MKLNDDEIISSSDDLTIKIIDWRENEVRIDYEVDNFSLIVSTFCNLEDTLIATGNNNS